jgi:hypothetical protein
MADLLPQESVEGFVSAMRSVTDTFHKYPVSLGNTPDAIDLLCGRKSIINEFKAREEGDDIDEAFELKFNRGYLADKGLVDEENELLIGYDTPVRINGKRYTIIKLDQTSVFRDQRLMVVMEVVR